MDQLNAFMAFNCYIGNFQDMCYPSLAFCGRYAFIVGALLILLTALYFKDDFQEGNGRINIFFSKKIIAHACSYKPIKMLR